MRFVCRNCSYRFGSNLDSDKRPCPYCGEKSVIPEPNAEDLLDEIE